jgi:hypothetical protein
VKNLKPETVTVTVNREFLTELVKRVDRDTESLSWEELLNDFDNGQELEEARNEAFNELAQQVL